MDHCPRCQSPLPDPNQSFCPSCGAVLGGGPGEPAAAPPLESTSAGIPWEEWQRYGFVPALVDTTKAVLGEPAAFFRRMPVTGGVQNPLIYALILGVFASVVGTIYGLVQQALLPDFSSMFEGRPELGPFAAWMNQRMGLVSAVMSVVVSPILVLAGLFIWSGLTHVLLMLFGGAQRGFEATFRTVCYSCAPAPLAVVPICGSLLGGVWSLVLQIIGLSEAHGTSKGVAAAAVLGPVILCCCCCGVFYAVAVGSVMSMLGQMR